MRCTIDTVFLHIEVDTTRFICTYAHTYVHTCGPNGVLVIDDVPLYWTVVQMVSLL